VAENAVTSVTRSPSSPGRRNGPEVTHGRPGQQHTIRAVESHTNFAHQPPKISSRERDDCLRISNCR
jgi:hypothetical protein